MDSETNPHEAFIRFLRTSQRVLMFTGAGVSTGSGIPDFRGPQGVWTRRQPVCYDDFMRSEEARTEHWDYKLEGWSAFREARPNAVHNAIVDLEHAGKLLLLVTQNIDGLHGRLHERGTRWVRGRQIRWRCRDGGSRSGRFQTERFSPARLIASTPVYAGLIPKYRQNPRWLRRFPGWIEPHPQFGTRFYARTLAVDEHKPAASGWQPGHDFPGSSAGLPQLGI